MKKDDNLYCKLNSKWSNVQRWLFDEEKQSKKVNQVFQEIAQIIWNLLLLNGGSIFLMSSIASLFLHTEIKTFQDDAIYLITLYTWWFSIIAFVLYIFMFMSKKIFNFIKKLMPSSNNNTFYENIYIITSMITPIIYMILIPGNHVIKQIVIYSIVFVGILMIVMAYLKWYNHYKKEGL